MYGVLLYYHTVFGRLSASKGMELEQRLGEQASSLLAICCSSIDSTYTKIFLAGAESEKAPSAQILSF